MSGFYSHPSPTSIRAVNRGSVNFVPSGSRHAIPQRSFCRSNLILDKMHNAIGCAVSVHMEYPCNTGEEGGNEPLGHPTNLERKRKGENSMLETRRTLEGM
jgi:hypothetical protein